MSRADTNPSELLAFWQPRSLRRLPRRALTELGVSTSETPNLNLLYQSEFERQLWRDSDKARAIAITYSQGASRGESPTAELECMERERERASTSEREEGIEIQDGIRSWRDA